MKRTFVTNEAIDCIEPRTGIRSSSPPEHQPGLEIAQFAPKEQARAADSRLTHIKAAFHCTELQ